MCAGNGLAKYESVIHVSKSHNGSKEVTGAAKAKYCESQSLLWQKVITYPDAFILPFKIYAINK